MPKSSSASIVVDLYPMTAAHSAILPRDGFSRCGRSEKLCGGTHTCLEIHNCGDRARADQSAPVSIAKAKCFCSLKFRLRSSKNSNQR